MQLAPPSWLTTVTGLSSEVFSGHAYLNGGGGLHVAFGGHSLLIAAMQPSLPLKTVQVMSCADGIGVVVGGGFCWGIGGLTITGGCCGGFVGCGASVCDVVGDV
jgi:hypothetical protein